MEEENDHSSSSLQLEGKRKFKSKHNGEKEGPSKRLKKDNKLFLKCLYCTFKTLDDDELDIHYKIHAKDEEHFFQEDKKTLKCSICRYKAVNQRNFDVHLKTHLCNEVVSQKNIGKVQATKWTVEEKEILLYCYEYAQFEKWNKQKYAVLVEEIKRADLSPEKRNAPLNKLQSLLSQIHKYFTVEKVRELRQSALKKAYNDFTGEGTGKSQHVFECSNCPYKSSQKRKFYIHLGSHVDDKVTHKQKVQKVKTLKWTIEEKKILLYCFEYSRFEKWNKNRNAIFEDKIKKLNLPQEKKSSPINKLQSLVSQMHKYLSEAEIKEITETAHKKANEDFLAQRKETCEKDGGKSNTKEIEVERSPYEACDKENVNTCLDLNFDDDTISQKYFKRNQPVRWTIEEKKTLLYCYEYAQFEKWNKLKSLILMEEIKKTNLPEEKKNTSFNKLQSLVSQMHKYLTEEEIKDIKQCALKEAYEDYHALDARDDGKKKKKLKAGKDVPALDSQGELDDKTSTKENLKILLNTDSETKSVFKCSYCSFQSFQKGEFYLHLETHSSDIISPKNKSQKHKIMKWTVEEKKILLYCYEYAQCRKMSGQKNAILVEEIKRSDLPDEKKSTPINKLQSLVSQMHKYLTKEEIADIKQTAMTDALGKSDRK